MISMGGRSGNAHSVIAILFGLSLGHIFYWELKALLVMPKSSTQVFNPAIPSPVQLGPQKNKFPHKPWSLPESSEIKIRTTPSLFLRAGERSWDTLGQVDETPKVWVVTPTYRHSHQHLYLTRTFQALYPVRHFINWVIVDQHEKSTERHFQELSSFLKNFPLEIRLIRSKVRDVTEPVVGKPKGVEGRREALKFIRSFRGGESQGHEGGVLYFGDDDNTYDPEIFYQIQSTKSVSVWPAGALASYHVISPMLVNGSVQKIFGSWIGGRRFPLDFAQFAVHINVLRKSNATIPFTAGYEENAFLKQLNVSLDRMEPLSYNCTKILVWHTKTFIGNRNKLKRKKLVSEIKSRSSWYPNLMPLLRQYYLKGSPDVLSRTETKPNKTAPSPYPVKKKSL